MGQSFSDLVGAEYNGPALAPPANTTSDFSNPGEHNTSAWIGNIAMIVVATVFFSLRAYSRFLSNQIWIEDVLLLLGFGNFIGAMYASVSFIYHPGYFIHMWNVTVRESIIFSYYMWLQSNFYSVGLALMKIALILEWCRVFYPQKRWKDPIFLSGVFIGFCQGAFGIAAIFILQFECTPREAIWNKLIPGYKCIDLGPLQNLSGSLHLVSDIVIFILPQKTIWGLHMSLKKRIGVAIIFGLGLLAIVCSIFRVTSTVYMTIGTTDTTYAFGPVILWAQAEMACGFFIASAPSLPRVLKETPWLCRMFGLNTNNSKTPAQGGSAGLRTFGGGGGSRGPTKALSRSTATGDAYSEIDDDNEIPLGSLEQARSPTKPYGKPAACFITATTEVTVTHDARSQSSTNVETTEVTPWTTLDFKK